MIQTVDIAITNQCNARCPQCQRTDIDGLGPAPLLPMTTWSLEDFKRLFPKHSLNDVKEYSFCGTWGDPMMAKDIGLICKYIIENSRASIIITTNGSIRNEDFYWNLGVRCGERLTIVFDVDGINDEMHQKYRRGAKLQKVLDNMYILSKTKSKALSQSIIFKHNQSYKKEIEELAKKWGSLHHNFVKSDRFNGTNRFYFRNENDRMEYLEKSDV
jgi:pyruvate-formate lyase-activating enzyme